MVLSGHRTSWYTRRGACSAVCRNIREALPEAYYEQLKIELMGYKEVSIRDYFDHLDEHWCKMDTKTIKRTTKSFYKPWDQIMHITKFSKQLDEEQEYIQSAGIKISNASKLQFYTEQMIDSKWFNKPIIIKWEKRVPARKT